MNDFTTATVTLSGANVEGYYDYVEGEFSDLMAMDITPTVVVGDDTSTATITAYILETTSMSGVLTIKVGSDSFATTISGKSWVKGNMYEYNVTVGDDGPDDIILTDGVYYIYSAEGLKAFADLVNGNTNTSGAKTSGDGFAEFGTKHLDINGQLMNAIDLGGIDDEGNGVADNAWTPIGKYVSSVASDSYYGVFDGGNFEISGLYTNSTDRYQALFGCIVNATIKNLGVSGKVTGSDYTGGIVGYATSNSTLSGCYNAAQVSGTSYTGGIVGCATSNSTLSGCYNAAQVSGTSYIGGVVGYATGSITECYNTADATIISSNTIGYTGGVAGCLLATTSASSSITNCYNEGSIESQGSRAGGIVGCLFTNAASSYLYYASASECYNKGAVSGTSDVGGVVGFSYGANVTDCYNAETATVKGTYTGTYSYVGGVAGSLFTFAYVPSATVSNCYNEGSVESDGGAVGGVVGYVYSYYYYSTTAYCCYVTKCYNKGYVSGTYYVGGNVGFVKGGCVTECYNTAKVNSTVNSAGGIVGWLYSFYSSSSNRAKASLSNCYNTGDVESVGIDVGGIVGYMYSYTSSYLVDVTYCYSSGAITGSNLVGGIVGQMDTNSIITTCCNVGSVTATSTSYSVCSGGILGASNSITVSGCYYEPGTASYGIGGTSSDNSSRVIAQTDLLSSIVSILNESQDSDYWQEDDPVAPINNGYPILSWQQ